MISQKESKQVKMGSWMVRLLTRDMKTKTKSKEQPTSNHKKNRKIKNNRKIKPMENITPATDHYSRERQM